MLPTLHPRRIVQTIAPENHRLPTDLNEAFELLYQRYAESVANWLAHRLNGNRDLALDMRDETFLRVWKDLPGWQERGIDPKHWLYRIAHARLVDYYRRRKAVSLSPEWEAALPDPTSVTDHEILQSDVARRVRHCVARLDPDQRIVIELRWFRQLSFQEIAERTGKTDAAVKGLHHRGLVHLRELVQRGWFETPFEQLKLPECTPLPQHRRTKAKQTPQPPPSKRQLQPQPAPVEQLSLFP